MGNKLISMTDFVLELFKKWDRSEIDSESYTQISERYAKFLKRLLELGMFVPCDENGNVLPAEYSFLSCDKGFVYGKATERVLFEGFEYHSEDDGFIYISYDRNMQIVYDTEEKTFLLDTNRHNQYLKTIEDLVKYNLTLTNNALKIWE